MTYFLKTLVLFSLLWFGPACKNKAAHSQAALCTNSLLKNPVSVRLPLELKEISGLGFSQELKQWVVVNDERGYLYFLNQDFKLLESKKFGPSGDYEGVEVVDSMVYIVNSKGDIYRYNYLSDTKYKTWETDLGLKNDVEGLGYDAKSNSLVIACKGSPHRGKKRKKVSWKAAYSFNLDKKKLTKKPSLKLSKKKMLDFYLASNTETQECLKRIERFSPSGVTHDTVKDHFYTLSAHGNLIVVSNRDSEIMNLIFLDKSHNQAEGIYILDSDKLIISDEASGFNGKITTYKF